MSDATERRAPRALLVLEHPHAGECTLEVNTWCTEIDVRAVKPATHTSNGKRSRCRSRPRRGVQPRIRERRCS